MVTAVFAVAEVEVVMVFVAVVEVATWLRLVGALVAAELEVAGREVEVEEAPPDPLPLLPRVGPNALDRRRVAKAEVHLVLLLRNVDACHPHPCPFFVRAMVITVRRRILSILLRRPVPMPMPLMTPKVVLRTSRTRSILPQTWRLICPRPVIRITAAAVDPAGLARLVVILVARLRKVLGFLVGVFLPLTSSDKTGVGGLSCFFFGGGVAFRFF